MARSDATGAPSRESEERSAGASAVIVYLWCSVAPAQTLLPMQGAESALSGATACTPMTEADPGLAPPDLASAAADCLRRGEFHTAAELEILMRIRLHYDASRIVDRHAFRVAYDVRGELGDAVQMGLTEQGIQRYRDAMADLLGGRTLRAKLLCAQLRAAGPPAYDPRYLLERMQAGSTAEDPGRLVPEFDAAAGWAAELNRIDCALE